MKPPLLAVVGPTASGKTDLALRLASCLNGEIVSADSRQVYLYMDIGTAKPSATDRLRIRHHLVDTVTPDVTFSLVRFLQEARRAIHEIHGRSRLPILAGGTAQYVWALLQGWQVPEAEPDLGVRSEFERRVENEGAQALYDELRTLDPRRAAEVQPSNVRRVIRALEVHHALGEQGGLRKVGPSFRTKIIGLALQREALYERIDARVDRMIAEGWVNEVRGLLERGYGPEHSSMSGVGYRELGQSLEGKLSLEDAVRRTKYGTHRFARGQHAWFRGDDDRISWHTSSPEGFDAAEVEVCRWLEDAL